MITPRRTRLLRVPDLAAFRATLVEAIRTLAPEEAGDTFILVPTHAASEQLRRTVEDRAVTDAGDVVVWPLSGTRSDLYDELARRLSGAPPRLSTFEREVILAGVGRDLAEEGIDAPFQLRPALVAEILGLYDHIRRLGRSIDDFDRNLRAVLEPEQETDRGARQLLQQTIFLAAVFRGYESRVTGDGRLDEHALRARLLDARLVPPLARVVVTVSDRIGEPEGLWPADFDLLARLPGLTRLDVVATEASLASGFLERLHAALPEIEEMHAPHGARRPPQLVAPLASGSSDPLCWTYRDREEELGAVARRVKANRHSADAVPLHRMAVVVQRPLPYLYLARDVFAGAGIPFETLDTLPLAAEPYAAAVDLVLDAVGSDFTRPTLLALLRSPHFALTNVAADSPSKGAPAPQSGAAPIGPAQPDDLPRSPADVRAHPRPSAAQDNLRSAARNDLRSSAQNDLRSSAAQDDRPPSAATLTAEAISACDFALAESRYAGGIDQLEALVARWSALGAPTSREERRQRTAFPAAAALLQAARALAPMSKRRLATEQISTLVGFLRAFDRPPFADDPTRERRLRVRAAVLGALEALGEAHARHDAGAEADVATLTAAVRRWIGSQTFATRSGEPGLQIVDARAARYGEFDAVQIAGMIEGEWPERARRNVLYPASLLALLEPLPAVADPSHRDRESLRASRAAFKDLIGSPSGWIWLSTVRLENDAVVEPSMLLDDAAVAGLPILRAVDPRLRVSVADALALDPPRPEVAPAASQAWAIARLTPDDRPAGIHRGAAGAWRIPRVSVSRLERYLDCPFRFFASEVLGLEEEPDDEDTRTPLERGRFLHDLWERFFAEWQQRGYRRIEPSRLPEARALFGALCERALAGLSPSEAALERTRLLGSALRPGIAHRVFAMEAERPFPIRERLLEFPLQGDFTFRGRSGVSRNVALSAKVDRIDILEGGGLRVIDYKSKKTPDIKQALQLPIYSFIALESLRRRGEEFSLAEALYLSFEGDRAVVPLKQRQRSMGELLDDAQDRLLATLDRIAEGQFPPQPARRSLCVGCPYRTVCRLEIVETDTREAADE